LTQKVTIRQPNGEEYKAHAKFAIDVEGTNVAEHGTRGLASELLASGLAAALGAPVPAVEVVELPPELPVSLRGGRRPAPGLAVASKTVEPWVDVNAADTLSAVPEEELALISALHGWIEASDRGHNMVLSNGRAYSIDHVTAFASTWSGGAGSGQIPDDQLMRDRLAAATAALRAAADRLEAVTDIDIDSAIDSVPSTWMADEVKSRFNQNLKYGRAAVAESIRQSHPEP
jgi:hypothetical protein